MAKIINLFVLIPTTEMTNYFIKYASHLLITVDSSPPVTKSLENSTN